MNPTQSPKRDWKAYLPANIIWTLIFINDAWSFYQHGDFWELGVMCLTLFIFLLSWLNRQLYNYPWVKRHSLLLLVGNLIWTIMYFQLNWAIFAKVSLAQSDSDLFAMAGWIGILIAGNTIIAYPIKNDILNFLTTPRSLK